MRDRLSDAGPAPPGRTDDPWPTFQRALARHLRRPGSVGAIEFSAPPDPTGGRARCTLQLAEDGALGWVTFRAAGESLLEEMVLRPAPVERGPIAAAVATTCRDRLAVPHPQLLAVRSQGRVGQRIDGLGPVRSGTIPTGQDPAGHSDPVDVAVEVNDHLDARERFQRIVQQVTGRPTIVDDDGDLAFDHVGHPVYVSFTEDDPTARIWAWVARGVRSRGDAALLLAELNRDEDLTSWVLDGRHVMQRSAVSVGPFLPRYVQFSVEHFLYTFSATRDDIAAHLGRR